MPYANPKDRQAQQKRYARTLEGKAARKRAATKYNRTLAHTLSNQRWREFNQEKVRAHGILAYHIKKGTIERPDHCERCHTPCTPHGHHHDYSRPLDVEWLCAGCHKEEHQNENHTR